MGIVHVLITTTTLGISRIWTRVVKKARWPLCRLHRQYWGTLILSQFVLIGILWNGYNTPCSFLSSCSDNWQATLNASLAARLIDLKDCSAPDVVAVDPTSVDVSGVIKLPSEPCGSLLLWRESDSLKCDVLFLRKVLPIGNLFFLLICCLKLWSFKFCGFIPTSFGLMKVAPTFEKCLVEFQTPFWSSGPMFSNGAWSWLHSSFLICSSVLMFWTSSGFDQVLLWWDLGPGRCLE